MLAPLSGGERHLQPCRALSANEFFGVLEPWGRVWWLAENVVHISVKRNRKNEANVVVSECVLYVTV